MGHTVTHCSFHNNFFSVFGENAMVESRYEGRREISVIGVHDVKLTKDH